MALNNFPARQNAFTLLHDDFATFEVLGHYNEPQSQQLSESTANRLPDGRWMAICRNESDIYYLGWQERTQIDHCRRSVFNIDVSKDGKTWDRYVS